MKKKILGLVLVTAMTYSCEGMIDGQKATKPGNNLVEPPVPTTRSSVEIVPYYLDKQQSKWLKLNENNNSGSGSASGSNLPNPPYIDSRFASQPHDQPANAPALPALSPSGSPWDAAFGVPPATLGWWPVPYVGIAGAPLVGSLPGSWITFAVHAASTSLANYPSATPSAAASQGRASLLPDPGDVLTWLWMTRAFVELAEHGTTTFFESMIAPYAEPAQLGHSTTASPTVPLARSAPSINSSVSSPSVDSQLLPNADSVDSNFATSSAGSSILPNANSIDSRFESHSNRSTVTEPIPPTSGQTAITIAPPVLLNNNPGASSFSSTTSSNATNSIIANANSTNSSIVEPNPAE